MSTRPQNPVLQVIAQSRDANARGDMFGGWLMGLMDLAGVVPISRGFNNYFATAAVNMMQFLKPVMIGGHVAIEAEITRTGNTSVTTQINVHVSYQDQPHHYERVATAEIVYVAISKIGQPTRLVPRAET
jgi:acyl-CoA thioesterase YciA